MSEQKREVFISYHTATAADTVRAAAEALEAAGISCWYAPRDCEDDFAGSIVRAIQGCRVFLFVLNASSGQSEHCMNEVSQAFQRYSSHDEICFLPFKIQDFRLSDGLSYYISRFHIMDGGLPPEQLKIPELVSRVKSLLSRESFREAEVELPAGFGVPERKSCRIVNAMQFPDSAFVGREREIAEIAEQLAQPDNKVFLVGMGGIGKSEIAKMYLKRYAGDYDVVRWIPFEQSIIATLANDHAFPIEGLSHTDYPAEDEAAYAKRKLRILNSIADRRVLLVIDNFDVEGDPDLTELCAGPYSILFTTRCHQSGSGIREIDVLPMTDPEELMGLFQAEYKRALSPEDAAYVREIIAFLDHHTLSIRLVAAAMQARRIRPAQMLQMLRENPEQLRENEKLSGMIFGRLKAVFRLTGLTEDELFVLKNLSLIQMGGIAVETFSEWCGADYDVIDDLIARSWILHDEVLDQIHLHPMITELMLEEVRRDPESVNGLIDCMVNSYGSLWRDSLKRKMQWLELAKTAYDRLPEGHPKQPVLKLLRADTLMTMSMRAASIPLYRELWESTGKNDALELRLKLCSKLAHAQALNGDVEDGCQTALEGWQLASAMPDDTLTPQEGYWKSQVLSRLAETTREMKDYDRSIGYARFAVEARTRFFRETMQQDRGWALYNLARTLYMRGAAGDYAESRSLLEEALELFGQAEDAWAQSYSYDLLGQILMREGKYPQALEMSQKCWDILLPRLGPENMDMAHNLLWRGNIYREMGDRENAADCWQRAAGIYRGRNAVKPALEAEALLAELL